jgi:ribonuclease BN (tRNA processing enzyme)
MRLTVLGRSPARPNPGEACAGYLFEGGGERVLVDIGPGVVAQLLLRGGTDGLAAVVVSHMHPDHMLDLITLRYAYPWRAIPHEQRLTVIVPPGASDQLTDLARGAGSRTHLEDVFRLVEHDGRAPLRFGRMTLTPIRTQHYIPCWGFRAEADGRTIAYTADTAPCDALRELGHDVDMLLSEATLRSLDEDAVPPDERGHLLAAEAGAAARESGARRLMLTHLPVEGDGGAAARSAASEAYGRAVEVAEPGGSYEV